MFADAISGTVTVPAEKERMHSSTMNMMNDLGIEGTLYLLSRLLIVETTGPWRYTKKSMLVRTKQMRAVEFIVLGC